ncbi:MAG: type II CRISPR-associated endonuclease Cas1, partial [Zetaproteobacteria bacterium]
GRNPWFGCVEDIAAVSLAHPAIRITMQALQALAEAGAVVLVADARRLPLAMMQPVRASGLVAGRVRRQAEWLLSQPEQAEALWGQIVAAKLAMQADALRRRGKNGHLRLRRLARQLPAGDPAQIEAQAARHYWKHLFSRDFRRVKPDAEDAINARLNYGYAILRALVARQIALTGLEPSLGLHHKSAANPFNLADDLMEPLRPLVDGIVHDHPTDRPLTPEDKRRLLGMIEKSVYMNDGREYRLHAALDAMVASLVRAMGRSCPRLVLPEAEGGEAE